MELGEWHAFGYLMSKLYVGVVGNFFQKRLASSTRVLSWTTLVVVVEVETKKESSFHRTGHESSETKSQICIMLVA